MEALALNCPGCQAPISQDMKNCPYCGRPVIITNFNDVNKLSNLDLNKYQLSISRNIAQGKGNPETNEISLGFIFLKLKLYAKANDHFSKAMETCFDNSELYMAAAVSALEGKKAYLTLRPKIDEAERYLNIALEIEPKGIYYYFLAYLRYDYHCRKGFNVNPNYKTYLEMARNSGVSYTDVDTLFGMLGVPVPDAIRL